MRRQLALFGGSDQPAFDAAFARARRTELADGAWVEEVPGWVRGHEQLFELLERGTRWRTEQRVMYERKVIVPRLIASLPRDGEGHPLISTMRAALAARYATAGGESIAFALGEGDLLVMGGSCQRTWRHGIPKVAAAGPRISIMFRPIWYPG